MEKFLIVDGNSIMNRAFYGVMNGKMLSTTTGIYTNAIYGFLNILFMIKGNVKPDYIAVSFDLKAPTFRHIMYENYKATRKSMPEELKEQMPLIKEILRAMNTPILEIEGYEADDVLGTVANENTKNNIFTYILTGDKDSFQLISDTTSIIIPTTKSGKTDYAVYTPELLMEKYSIAPNQVIEVKALMGDSSDNIPGVKGVGEKTAYSLIGLYKNIDNIYENISNIDVTKGVRAKLEADKEMAYTSKTLATIDVNVPIDIDYSKCKEGNYNNNDLYNLLKKLEFNKFIDKLSLSNPEENAPFLVDPSIKNYENIKEDLKYIQINSSNLNYITNLNAEDTVSYYFNNKVLDNSLNSLNSLIDYNVLAFFLESNNTIFTIKLDEDYSKLALELFIKSKCTKIGYNIKQDLLYFFNNIGSDISSFNFDLMIAYYLLDSNRSKYSLEYIFENLFEIDYNEYISCSSFKNEQVSMFELDSNTNDENSDKISKSVLESISKYLILLSNSYMLINERLNNLNLSDLFYNMEMPLVETLAYMEYIGMYVNINTLNEFNAELTKDIANLENEIYSIAKEEFNINSTKQLGVILFDKLNLPVVRKNKTGYSTDKEVLEELEDKHEIIPKILEYRQLVKLKSTYVDGLKDKLSVDGRVHTTFMQTVASTGRLSSIDPNLQNIPVRTQLGRKIRKFFESEPGYSLIDADYSQIELRVLAHIANDEKMIEAFNNDIDIHKVTASQVFDTNLEDVTSDMRSKAKAVNFGIVYGISDFGLAKNINVSVKESSTYIKNYLSKYNGINEFMKNIVLEAKANGYVSTLFNRIRYIPELSNKNKNIIQFGERIAMNTPIQGTAADIIKLAMNKLYHILKSKNLKSKIIMQVHDELIVESPENEVDEVKQIMKDVMENIISLKVPLKVDINVGKSWYDTK